MRIDLGCFWRVVRRHKGSIAFALISVGLAIGLTTIIFSLYLHLVLRPLPLPVHITQRIVRMGGLSAPPGQDRLAWWGQAQSIRPMSMFTNGTAVGPSRESTETITVCAISDAFFEVLPVQPQLGTVLLPSDIRSEQTVAVISFNLWKQQLGSAAVIGTDILLNQVPHTIVGVLPPNFSFPERTDVWIPLKRNLSATTILDADTNTSSPMVDVNWIGRLTHNATPESARDELLLLLHRLHESYTARTGLRFGDIIHVNPLTDFLGRPARPMLLTLMVGAALVVFIATMNSSLLLLGISVARQKEFATRLALGASQFRILQQVLTECIVLAMCAAALGLVFASLADPPVRAWLQLAWPTAAAADLFDPLVFGFTTLLAISTGFVSGLAPALQSARLGLDQFLRSRSAGPASGGSPTVRNILIITQVSVSLVLVVSAGLVLRTLISVGNVNLGFHPEGVLSARVDVSGAALAGQDNANATIGRFAAVINALTAVPGVKYAALGSRIPLSATPVTYLPVVTDRRPIMVQFSMISGPWFSVLGTRLREGRLFRDHERYGVIVNETAARLLFPGENSVGQQVRIEGEQLLLPVIGVVADVIDVSPEKSAEPQMYLPYGIPIRTVQPRATMSVLIACNRPCLAALSATRATGPLSAVHDVAPLSKLVLQATAARRVTATALGTYATLALVLATIGIYAVVTYVTASRKHELGIRAALGASPAHVVTTVFESGFRPLMIGVTLGLVASVVAGRLIQSLLWGVGSVDKGTYVVASLLLCAAGASAAAIPALHARKLNPSDSLRSE